MSKSWTSVSASGNPVPDSASAPLVDSHAHLDDQPFAQDLSAVMARARRAGVVAQVLPAVGVRDFEACRKLGEAWPDIHPAYGLHPMLEPEHDRDSLDELERWLDRERPVALGECGLDYYIEGLDRDRQLDHLHLQFALARARDLPVIVHGRRAFEAVIIAIRAHPGLRGVVHSFAGSTEQARQLIDLGFHLGLGGPVTYPGARRIRKVAVAIPLDRLLLETDAPDQPLHGHQGQRNEPAQVAGVCAVIAELRGLDFADVAQATTRNSAALFGLDLLSRP